MNNTVILQGRGPQSINAMTVRRYLGRDEWRRPLMFGNDGWAFARKDGTGSVIVTVAPHDEHDWVHASIAWADHMPSYDDLVMLHRAVFNNGWAYLLFPPPEEHVNIHNNALHLYGRLDGKPVTPDFTGIVDGKRSI